jgi:hypothetical protein
MDTAKFKTNVLKFSKQDKIIYCKFVYLLPCVLGKYVWSVALGTCNSKISWYYYNKKSIILNI